MKTDTSLLRTCVVVAWLVTQSLGVSSVRAAGVMRDVSNVPCSLEEGCFAISGTLSNKEVRTVVVELPSGQSPGQSSGVRITSAPEMLLPGGSAVLRFELCLPDDESRLPADEASLSGGDFLYRLRPCQSRMRATQEGGVRFHRLPPGRYEFEVAARGPDGAFIGTSQRAVFTVSDLVDFDGDGIDNAWETAHGLDPLDAYDGAADADGDGLSGLEEYGLGTSPFAKDSDLDGVPDAADDRLDPFAAAYPNTACVSEHESPYEVPFDLTADGMVYVTACAAAEEDAALAVTVRKAASERLLMAFVGRDGQAPYEQKSAPLSLRTGSYTLAFHADGAVNLASVKVTPVQPDTLIDILPDRQLDGADGEAHLEASFEVGWYDDVYVQLAARAGDAGGGGDEVVILLDGEPLAAWRQDECPVPGTVGEDFCGAIRVMTIHADFLSPGRHRLALSCVGNPKVYALRVFRTEPTELVCLLTRERAPSSVRGPFREIVFDTSYPCDTAFYIDGVARTYPGGHDELSFVLDGAGPFFDGLFCLDGEMDKGQPYAIAFDVPDFAPGTHRLVLLAKGSPEWWGILVWRKTVPRR